MPPIQIALLIHSLQGGGAERQMAMLANHLAELGHECTLITLSATTLSSPNAYPLSSNVKLLELNLDQHSSSFLSGLLNNWRRVQTVRRTLRNINPDILISFTDRMNILALAAGSEIRTGKGALPIVICERSDPRKQNLGKVWEFLRRRYYPRCSMVVSQTPAINEYLKTITHGRPSMIIPSAIEPPSDITRWRSEYLESKRTKSPTPSPISSWPGERLIAVGRLSHEKGFDLLLDAWSPLASQHPEWKLILVGSGGEEARLRAQAETLGISERVEWIPWQNDIWKAFCQADAFVLPSRYEGFPQALLQAMACGLPVVAMPCSDAIGEVIQHDIDGWIVEEPTVESLTHGLDQLLDNASRQIRFQENSAIRVQDYHWHRLKARWEEVLSKTIDIRPNSPRPE